MSKVTIDVPTYGHKTWTVFTALVDENGNVEPCNDDDSFLRKLAERYPYDERHNHIN